MLTIKFAKKDLVINKNTKLTELLQNIENIPPTFAVILNQHFITKGQYEKTILQQGDQIEIITPMQGG